MGFFDPKWMTSDESKLKGALRAVDKAKPGELFDIALKAPLHDVAFRAIDRMTELSLKTGLVEVVHRRGDATGAGEYAVDALAKLQFDDVAKLRGIVLSQNISQSKRLKALKLIQDPASIQEIAHTLMSFSDPYAHNEVILAEIASNPSISESLLADLAQYDDPKVKENVAKNEATPAEIRAGLMND